MKTKSFLSVALLATAVSMAFTACSSSDDDDPVNGGNDNQPYVWGTDGKIGRAHV